VSDEWAGGAQVSVVAPLRPRNDPGQYDDLSAEWWPVRGAFAALQWLAAARGPLIPPAPHTGALLIDVACGGGLLAPHVPPGYRHVGVDLSAASLREAREHGVAVARADALRLPFRDRCAQVVVAGEILEHVTDPAALVAEVCRVLAPGGTVVVDTLADTAFARLTLVTLGERIPGGPPRHCHDPALFVDPAALQRMFARHDVALRVRGLRPSGLDYLRWVTGRAPAVRMLPVRSTAGVYQGVGVKR
jgi:2-polyprenyl-6-hydroxyphenyl methylase/3-demethylubiquinone-9 3-methyltransferase